MARGRPLVKESGQEPDEQRLIEAAQKDPARFAELYEINFERVYAFIVRRVQDRIEAQDLTSDVFHQALANLGRFEWRGTPFAAWLFRIAANAIADRFERRLPIRDDELRSQLGIDAGPNAPAFVAGDGQPICADQVGRWLRMARLVATSLEANGGICRALLQFRHGLTDDHETEEVRG